MDAFYTSVEQLDNPQLKGKPIVVGGNKKRGVVAAASYEARKYGISSAMSSVIAKNKCKDLIFVKPRFERYKEISQKIKNVFHQYTDLVEPLSLDEAFLDVTEISNESLLASDIAYDIRSQIFQKLGLKSSAGISINKFVAKMATEVNKPDGQKTIHPLNVDSFLDSLPIENFFGIGRVTAKKMKNLGVYFGYDLRKLDLSFLVKNFGKTGDYFYQIIRSQYDNPVNPNRRRKSVGTETTFRHNITSDSFILEELKLISKELESRMIKSNKKGKTLTIKIKYDDFKQQTRSRTLDHYIYTKNDFYPIIEDLIYSEKINKPVRLLGISISNFLDETKKSQEKIQLEFKF